MWLVYNMLHLNKCAAKLRGLAYNMDSVVLHDMTSVCLVNRKGKMRHFF